MKKRASSKKKTKKAGGFDPTNITIKKKRRARELDPEKIFESLTLRGSIENPWGPQTDALRTWHGRRDEDDLVIEMNTGGGKTLVGLLIGQSLVNETGKHVLFVCPTKQLIEQAADKADECGLEVATYMSGHWEDRDVADEGRGLCITNYDAVFNGKSIFNRIDLGGLVLDDAHVAGSIIRSQFTINVRNQEPLYSEIVKIIRPYFTQNSQERRLESAIDGDPNALLFFPMFEWRRCYKQVVKLLVEAGVEAEKKWLFAWEHIKDHLNRCVLTISGHCIEIAPPVLPLHRIPCLQSAGRRVYLTATVPSPVEFVKTFGVVPEEVIKPKGKLGEAQRLFLLADGKNNDEQRKDTKRTIKKHKACIISPSHPAADEWLDVGNKFNLGDDQSVIEEFKEATDTRKLILVARYNGVDLPGDSCQVLVIDGLPRGTSLLNRFLDEGLQILSLRASNTAIRMVQAVGRIFRSNTDHGVVILTGVDVIGWARSPSNLKHLPSLLQRQVQFGLSLNDNIKTGGTTAKALIEAVLTGDRNWDKLYQSNIEEFDVEDETVAPEWLLPLCQGEQRAYAWFWEGNYGKAASAFRTLADNAATHDKRLAAWYRHWEGAACDNSKDRTGALLAYSTAANVRSELGRPEADATTVLKASAAPTPGSQAKNVASIIAKRGRKTTTDIEKLQTALVYGPKTNPVEQALKELGEFLGLDAYRPDTPPEGKTGPDIVWRHIGTKSGAALEAKTDKKEQSQYRKKDDIGQFHDHVKFLERKHPKERFYQIIVGRELRVSTECHPPDELRIIELDHFKKLTDIVLQLYSDALNDDAAESAEVTIQRWLDHWGLNWPDCVEALPSMLAIDLQQSHVADAEED